MKHWMDQDVFSGIMPPSCRSMDSQSTEDNIINSDLPSTYRIISLQ